MDSKQPGSSNGDGPAPCDTQTRLAGAATAVLPAFPGLPARVSGPVAEADGAVTALYRAHAVGMIRLAVVLVGDWPTAEDVVQDAFGGLYRRWEHLADPDKAASYVRSAVLNGCRSELRRRIRAERRAAPDPVPPDPVSAEVTDLIERCEMQAALRRLSARQREALVLRFYLELSEAETAASMRISRGTVKSTISRALRALGRELDQHSGCPFPHRRPGAS